MPWTFEEHEILGIALGAALGFGFWATAGLTMWWLRDRKGKR